MVDPSIQGAKGIWSTGTALLHLGQPEGDLQCGEECVVNLIPIGGWRQHECRRCNGVCQVQFQTGLVYSFLMVAALCSNSKLK